MSMSKWLVKYADARTSLRNGKPDQAAIQAVPLLEGILRHLIFDNLNFFDRRLRDQILQRRREAKRNRESLGLFFLENLYEDFQIFVALERATGRSTLVLRTLDLEACRLIRNKITHDREKTPQDDIVTADEARLLLSTTEHLLAYVGADVEHARDGDPETAPLRFSNRDDCLGLLLRKIWEYPDNQSSANENRSSWAVKESAVLKGDLDGAIEHPGLGIALFTTELASEVFGTKAVPKITACVDWGVSRTTGSSLRLISEAMTETITGEVINKSDFRHTIALAILMIRSRTHKAQQKQYLEYAVKTALGDGGWPAIPGNTKSDLTATVYAVEYLAASLKSSDCVPPELEAVLRLGQEWLILAATPEGGWATGIFSGTSWDRSWSTAYLLQRLLAKNLPSFPEWSQALTDAVEILLRDTSSAEYKDKLLKFRVEARIAAALARALQFNVVPLISREISESWLREWERRSLDYLHYIPAKECDLATATFISRALLYGKNYREVGESVLAEL